MKKVIFSILSVALISLFGVSIFMTTGCNIPDDTAKIIASNAGRYTVLGWVMIDDPSEEIKGEVKKIIEIIKTSSSSVEIDKTYTEVLLPIIVKDVILLLPSHLQIICTAGTIAIFGGLDVMFTANPEWKKDSQKAVTLVSEFCKGADDVLILTEDDEVYQSMMSFAKSRQSLNKDHQEYINTIK